jgi:chromosomal replication initiator protein
MRPLLGMLDSLKASHRGRATAISLEQVRAAAMSEPIGVERIVKRVAETYGVKPRELLGPSRLRNVLLPRQVAMFLARDVALLSLPSIGEHFGGRDHSTVQHAVNKIRVALAGDRQLAGTIRQLKLELS